MGRYFGREPRYSQQEAEAQAKQAIEAAVSKGRPPEEEWKGLGPRMADINREVATRPPVDIPPPPVRRRANPEAGSGEGTRPRRPMNQILRPPTPPSADPAPDERATQPESSAPPPTKRARRAPASGAPDSPAKRAGRATKPPAPAKRTAAKKRPG